MPNKVQEKLVSSPITVEGVAGEFRFRMPTIYDEIRVLVRQGDILGTDPRNVSGAAALLAYMTARLELLTVAKPKGFDLAEVADPDLVTAVHEAMTAWQQQFRAGVRQEQKPVGKRRRVSGGVSVPEDVPASPDDTGLS